MFSFFTPCPCPHPGPPLQGLVSTVTVVIITAIVYQQNLEAPAVFCSYSIAVVFTNVRILQVGGITLAGIACIIMRKVYATIGESIYPNPSFLSRDFPEASGRLLRNHKQFTFQDMAD